MILSVDAMGGDDAPGVVLEGLDRFCRLHRKTRILLHGRPDDIEPFLDRYPEMRGQIEIRPADAVVKSSDKPSQALRRARGTSMWNAVESVKAGEAQAAVSAGNTGALMAISMLVLRKMEGVHRPGMTAIWPTLKGRCVVLDVGANLEADARQLYTYAIMGEAYSRAITGNARPRIGLLNIGAEETKGHEEIRQAADLLRANELDLNYIGFVEGNDISEGAADVIVTDGFTGNVALKTAEGTARLVGGYLRESLTSGPLSKAGAVIASKGLKQLKERMNPSRVNGGVLLGLNGLVVKSHGGTDAEGFETALSLASNLANSQYSDDVRANLSKIAVPDKAETPEAAQ